MLYSAKVVCIISYEEYVVINSRSDFGIWLLHYSSSSRNKFPHQCAHCPKSFKKPSDLTRHVRIHTGEKPYGCATCGRTFTVKSTLDSHMRTHRASKCIPISCWKWLYYYFLSEQFIDKFYGVYSFLDLTEGCCKCYLCFNPIYIAEFYHPLTFLW